MLAFARSVNTMAIGAGGTGKTETFKELTKSVGRKSVVFNCSSTVDYNVILKFFKV